MKIFLLGIFLLILVVEVSAIGIGGAPAELNFNIEKGKSQKKELTVYNLEDMEAEFEVNSNAKFLQFYHNGIIEAVGAEKIIVEAITENLKEGNYEENIYITSSNSASGLKFNLGAAIKTNVKVFTIAKTNVLTGVITSITIVVVGLMIYFALINRKIFAIMRKTRYW